MTPRRPYSSPMLAIHDGIEGWLKHTAARGLALPFADVRICTRTRKLPTCEHCQGRYRVCAGGPLGCTHHQVVAARKPTGTPQHHDPEHLDRAIDVRACFEGIPEESTHIFALAYNGVPLREIASRGGVSTKLVSNVLFDVLTVVTARMKIKKIVA